MLRINMLKSIVVVGFSLCLTLVSSQEHQCGPSLLLGPSGWFASPPHLSNFPRKTNCQWEIHVKEGSEVLIEFMDLRVGENDDAAFARSNYIRVFDAGDESASTYISQRTMMLANGKNPTYLSKSNDVIVEFVSDGSTNAIGFNASYEAVKKEDFCDISQLTLGSSIDVDATKCQHEGVTNHFKTCLITCSQRYTMKSRRQVICENGKFLPERPCGPIDLEVKLCQLTNMEYCLYTLGELESYWRSNDIVHDYDEKFGSRHDDDNASNNFMVSQEGVTTTTVPAADTGINLERRRTNSLREICSPPRGWRSYCSKDRNGYFAYSCDIFSSYEKLSRETASQLKKICLLCRFHACTNQIPYI